MVDAQYYSLGQNPSSTRWKQINTESFQLIFPDDFEDRAQELANILVYANEVARNSLETKPKKISIILQNNTTVDNGFVTLAPKRSEFYGTPSQENEGVDWLKKLAVHEYRHVVQFEKYNEGVGKVLKLMFGQQGMGALILLTTPLWMLEGDAVHTETEFTERGRGKYGPFLREFEAQIAELDPISYEKAAFGSFKQYVTDHYKLGFYLSEFVSENYGRDVWDSVLHCVVRNPFPPYPFSFHLKRITGKTTSQLYADLITNRLQIQSNRSGFYDTTPYEEISPKSIDFSSYQNPVLTEDTAVIAVKKSFNHPVRIVKLKGGEESLVHIPGVFDGNTLSYGSNMLIWSEKRKHPRWDYLDYSEVVIFDIKSKKRRRLKRKTRWFSPTFSPDGNQIALIEIDKANDVYLNIVDLEGNSVKRVFLTDKNAYHVNWYATNKIVVAINDNGKGSLGIVDLEFLSVRKTASLTKPISYPTPYKEGFLIQTLDKNKDCIAYFIEEDDVVKLHAVVNPEFGLDFISIDSVGNEVIYSDYHSQGSVIVRSEIEIGEKIQFSAPVQLPRMPAKTFEVKKYRPLLNLFNFHSWAPLSLNPDAEVAGLGASLFSQNLLSSSILSLNYDYLFYTREENWSVKYNFEHFYPKIFAESSFNVAPNSQIQNVSVDIQSINYQGGSSLNLYFNGSKFRKTFIMKGAYVYNEAKYDFEEGYVDTLVTQENTQWFGVFSVNHKYGLRDIYSPWSFMLSSASFINLRSSQNAHVLNAVATVPGVLKNDGLKISLGKQWGTDVYVPNYLNEPRGVLNQSFTRGERMSIEYGLPLWYPDLKLSRLAYLQRIRANCFYDFLQVFDDQSLSYFSSIGGTVYFDFNPLRYAYLTEIGFQFGVDRSKQFFFGPSFNIIY